MCAARSAQADQTAETNAVGNSPSRRPQGAMNTLLINATIGIKKGGRRGWHPGSIGNPPKSQVESARAAGGRVREHPLKRKSEDLNWRKKKPLLARLLQGTEIELLPTRSLGERQRGRRSRSIIPLMNVCTLLWQSRIGASSSQRTTNFCAQACTRPAMSPSRQSDFVDRGRQTISGSKRSIRSMRWGSWKN